VSSKEFNGVETPAPGRLKLRELVSLARERFKEKAVELKTREELEAALFGDGSSPVGQAQPAPPPAPRVVVTRDFFVPVAPPRR